MSQEESSCFLRVRSQSACSGFQGPPGSSLSPFSPLPDLSFVHSILAVFISVPFLKHPGLLQQRVFVPSVPSAWNAQYLCLTMVGFLWSIYSNPTFSMSPCPDPLSGSYLSASHMNDLIPTYSYIFWKEIICVWCTACVLSCVWPFVTPWTVACQVLLSMGFSRQDCWSGLPFPPPGDLPDPGVGAASPAMALHF